MKAQSRSTADGVICQQPPIMETEGLEPKASVLFLAQEKPKTGTEREDHLFLSAARLASQGCKCPGASALGLLMGGGEPLSMQMPMRPQIALTGTSLVITCRRGTKPVHHSIEAHMS